MKYTITALSMLAMAVAQQVGTEEAEVHPKLSWSDCTSGSCSTKSSDVVIDANWRWAHNVGYVAILISSCYLARGTDSNS